MSLNRAAFLLLLFLYALFVLTPHARVYAVTQLAFGTVATGGIFAHILWHPAPNRGRRLFAMMSDFGTICFQMHVGDSSGALFYPLLLWTIFGNGFRFGLRSLFAATAIGVLGFVAVVRTTPFWLDHHALTIGLGLGAVMLPSYAGTLIRKLSMARARAEEARQAAEEASAAKSNFLASVSHELRTPLNAIIGIGGLLLETRLSNAQSEAARTIDAAAKSLLSMIDGVLDFSRIEAGRMPVSKVRFDVAELLSHTRRLFAAQARAKGISVGVHVAPGTPLTVVGDRRHLGEILFNLVGNAVKFTSRGDVLVAVEARGGEGQICMLRFEVVDTGMGIAPEAQAHVFEPFMQADATIVGQFGGTGLGLALCRKLVGLLGGEIGLESRVGEGSTFRFDIPVERVATAATTLPGTAVDITVTDRDIEQHIRACCHALDVPLLANGARKLPSGTVVQIADSGFCMIPATFPRVLVLDGNGPVGEALRHRCDTWVPAAAAPAELAAAIRIAVDLSAAPVSAVSKPSPPAAIGDRHLHILVAEDNRTNQLVICKILDRAGHTTVVVEDGEAAVEALDQTAFDLVLMDVNMPGMSGIEATKLYRFGALGRPHLPILALTADATPATATACEEAGMDACITKPIEPRRLLEIIAEFGNRPGNARSEDGARRAKPPPRRTRPNLRLVTSVDLDPNVAADLEALGGADFVSNLYAEFAVELDRLLGKLQDAIGARDFQEWRAQIHAIRSAAVNVGAKRLLEICTPLETGSHLDFGTEGPEHLALLRVAAADLNAEIERRGGSRRAAL
ncbi:MAG TPA: ATP-binding protein [Acetobacteraceae bacterium]|nr:ATP-binding protein [Acetobacteraceae bacterium]